MHKLPQEYYPTQFTAQAEHQPEAQSLSLFDRDAASILVQQHTEISEHAACNESTSKLINVNSIALALCLFGIVSQ